MLSLGQNCFQYHTCCTVRVAALLASDRQTATQTTHEHQLPW